MRNFIFATLLGSLLFSPADATGQELLKLPEKAKFFVHVNIDSFRKTELGARLFEMARAEAMVELDDKKADLEKLRETLGFDPFTDLDAVTMVGSDFDKPELQTHLIIKLKKTTGNVEGLIATLPDYDSSEYGDHIIHSARPDENKRLFAAIHTDRRDAKRIVVAPAESQVEDLLDMLDGRNDDRKSVELDTRNGQFVHIELLEMPDAKLVGRGPQANITKMMKGLALKVASDDGELKLTVRMDTTEERQAKQIRQMVQGASAMLQMVNNESDEDFARAQRILDELKVRRDGKTVRIELKIPEQDLVDLVEHEMAELEI